MGKQCKTQSGSRDWTKEEMIAYLDWDRAEDERGGGNQVGIFFSTVQLPSGCSALSEGVR